LLCGCSQRERERDPGRRARRAGKGLPLAWQGTWNVAVGALSAAPSLPGLRAAAGSPCHSEAAGARKARVRRRMRQGCMRQGGRGAPAAAGRGVGSGSGMSSSWLAQSRGRRSSRQSGTARSRPLRPGKGRRDGRHLVGARAPVWTAARVAECLVWQADGATLKDMAAYWAAQRAAPGSDGSENSTQAGKCQQGGACFVTGSPTCAH
jgi:hypothetical protein